MLVKQAELTKTIRRHSRQRWNRARWWDFQFIPSWAKAPRYQPWYPQESPTGKIQLLEDNKQDLDQIYGCDMVKLRHQMAQELGF